MLRVSPALHGWRDDEELRVDVDPLRDVLDALADLERALELDPENADIMRELKRARKEQKSIDAKASNMYTKMIGTGTEV